MSVPEAAPFGSWRSRLSAGDVASAGVSLAETRAAGELTYWLEHRPVEGGRTVIVRGDGWSQPVDLTPEGFDVRTRVHEYGGGAYLVDGSTVFFSNDADQRLYRQDAEAEPRPITPDPPAPRSHRYADGSPAGDGRWIVCVRERHEAHEVVNELAVLAADGSAEPVTIAGGHDFYAFPRPSPDGSRLAFLTWDHPRMPWDGSELWVADLAADGALGEPRKVVGGPEESIYQPAWSPRGILHFVSDRTGWWNLYRLGDDGEAEALRPMEAEFGVPLWELGYASYAFLLDGRIACVYSVEGTQHLALMDPDADQLLDVDVPYTTFDPPSLAAEGGRVAFVGGGPTLPHRVVSLDFTARSVDELRESRLLPVPEEHVSVPRSIEFPTDGGRTAHALFYPPRNPDFAGPEGERPPLLVLSHGGPTSETTREFDAQKQFWTSRGFAIVDVNYGGSTGHGRAYRRRLAGTWGITDVHDCVAAARYLAEQGEVDADRLVIRGGSAGGYTTLCALTFHDEFAAGSSWFGVADAEALARDTHKFESRYLDGLIGPYPETAELYRARSPIHFTDLLSSPVILLQGLEDEVVLPAQAEAMAAALDAKGLPFAYLAFEGEQHGFRKAENVQRALEAELSFFARIFGFEPADDLPPLEIHNL